MSAGSVELNNLRVSRASKIEKRDERAVRESMVWVSRLWEQPPVPEQRRQALRVNERAFNLAVKAQSGVGSEPRVACVLAWLRLRPRSIRPGRIVELHGATSTRCQS